LGRYATDGKVSDILIQELRDFLNGLYVQFKIYDPFFIISYDDGYCQQQKVIDNSYKAGRSTLNLILDNNQEIELFRQIKKYYYQKIEQMFTKKDRSRVYYLREFEADFIPHYCIVNGLFDSDQPDILNVILSTDKDLLQTCKFTNTVQCVTSFQQNAQKGAYQIQFDVFDNENAISYFIKNFKRGILTAEYVPLILSIGGDKSDEIPSLCRAAKLKEKIGTARAAELIINHSIPPTISAIKNNLNNMPDIIKNNIDILERHYKLISFEEQLKRTPKHIFNIPNFK